MLLVKRVSSMVKTLSLMLLSFISHKKKLRGTSAMNVEEKGQQCSPLPHLVIQYKAVHQQKL